MKPKLSATMPVWHPTPEIITQLLHRLGFPALPQKSSTTTGSSSTQSSTIKISIVQDLPLYPDQGFDSQSDILSKLYILTTSDLSQKFLLRVFPDTIPFRHPATVAGVHSSAAGGSGNGSGTLLMRDMVKHAIENELGAMQWVRSQGVHLPKILGAAYYKGDPHADRTTVACLSVNGILGLFMTEFPKDGVIYQGPHYRSGQLGPSQANIATCQIAAIFYEMRRLHFNSVASFQLRSGDGIDNQASCQDPKGRMHLGICSRFDLIVQALVHTDPYRQKVSTTAGKTIYQQQQQASCCRRPSPLSNGLLKPMDSPWTNLPISASKSALEVNYRQCIPSPHLSKTSAAATKQTDRHYKTMPPFPASRTASPFDKDPTVYSSRHDQRASGTGGIRDLTYEAFSVERPPRLDSFSSLSPSPICQNISPTREGTIQWPTEFVPRDRELSVMEYEQAQLMNALVALERLDSMPGSESCFPKPLLELLPRILRLAMDGALFPGSTLPVGRTRKGVVSGNNPQTREKEGPTKIATRGIFDGIETVMTHSNLDASAFVVNPNEGHVLAMLNLQHAAILPEYEESPRRIFVECRPKVFWNSPVQENDSDLEEEEEESSLRLRRLLRGSLTLRQGHASTFSTSPMTVKDSMDGRQVPPFMSKNERSYALINHRVAVGASLPPQSMVYRDEGPLPNTPSGSARTLGRSGSINSKTESIRSERSMAASIKSFASSRWSRLRSTRASFQPFQASAAHSSPSLRSASYLSTNTTLPWTPAATNSTSVPSFSPPRLFTTFEPVQVRGHLALQSPVLNQACWSGFLDSLREKERLAHKKRSPESHRGIGSGTRSWITPSTSFSFASSSSHSLTSSPHLSHDADRIDQGRHPALQALVNTGRTLQNLIVALEAGAVVLTPDQLLRAIGERKMAWQEKEQDRVVALQASEQMQREYEMDQQHQFWPSKGRRFPLDGKKAGTGAGDNKISFRTLAQKFKFSSSKTTSPLTCPCTATSNRSRAGSVASSYRPKRTSEDDILYSAPGLQRDPIPSELPHQLLSPRPPPSQSGPHGHLSLQHAHKSHDRVEYQQQLSNPPPTSPLGSMTAAHLPVYGLRLSNQDGTQSFQELEQDRVRAEEERFWAGLEPFQERHLCRFSTECDPTERRDPEKNQGRLPGVVLLQLEELVQQVEILERYVDQV